MGKLYMNNGMLDEAILSYQRCIEINPKVEICYLNLG